MKKNHVFSSFFFMRMKKKTRFFLSFFYALIAHSLANQCAISHFNAQMIRVFHWREGGYKMRKSLNLLLPSFKTVKVSTPPFTCSPPPTRFCTIPLLHVTDDQSLIIYVILNWVRSKQNVFGNFAQLQESPKLEFYHFCTIRDSLWIPQRHYRLLVFCFIDTFFSLPVNIFYD